MKQKIDKKKWMKLKEGRKTINERKVEWTIREIWIKEWEYARCEKMNIGNK